MENSRNAEGMGVAGSSWLEVVANVFRLGGANIIPQFVTLKLEPRWPSVRRKGTSLKYGPLLDHHK